jgi:hypothetical protein
MRCFADDQYLMIYFMPGFIEAETASETETHKWHEVGFETGQRTNSAAAAVCAGSCAVRETLEDGYWPIDDRQSVTWIGGRPNAHGDQ